MVKILFKPILTSSIFAILFFTSCFSPSQNLDHKRGLSQEEYHWIEAFFHKIMLSEVGIFTLCGSKPLIFFEIDYPNPEREREISLWYESLSEEEKEKQIFLIEDKDLQSEWFLKLPEQAQKNAVIKKSSNEAFYVAWEKWRKMSTNLPISKYFFVERSIFGQANRRYLFFINISEAFLVLNKNYEVFKRKTEKDFDPLNTVFEIQNEESEFWKIALQDDELIGILCGFGAKNAFYYSRTNRVQNEDVKKFLDALPRKPTCQSDEWRKISPFSFPIPGFISFIKNDEMVEKYKREKEKIKKEYRNKDFVYFTLEKLSS
jgi:hypothetical protein